MMPKCKKCEEPFEVPEHAIEQVYAIYCVKCIQKAVNKTAKMTTEEYMKLQAKSILL